MYKRFGLTDTTIKLISKNEYLVLTDDLDLCGILNGHGVDAVNFNHFRMFYWDK